MKIEVNIFTNSTINAPSTKLIESTYKSFRKTFKGEYPIKVWCDPKPNTDAADQYIKNLTNKFGAINITTGLSDGYTQAVKSSTADFLFMLEHDWEFMPNIKNSLEEVVQVMQQHNLLHIRFNKRQTVAKKMDKTLTEVDGTLFKYCITPGLSNNPHLINKQLWLDVALPYVHVTTGSLGIEKELTKSPLTGAIYGPMDYPNTITHKDGKSLH